MAKTEDLFRELAMKKFGYKKGSLSQGLEEAIRYWIELNRIQNKLELEVQNQV